MNGDRVIGSPYLEIVWKNQWRDLKNEPKRLATGVISNKHKKRKTCYLSCGEKIALDLRCEEVLDHHFLYDHCVCDQDFCLSFDESLFN